MDIYCIGISKKNDYVSDNFELNYVTQDFSIAKEIAQNECKQSIYEICIYKLTMTEHIKDYNSQTLKKKVYSCYLNHNKNIVSKLH